MGEGWVQKKGLNTPKDLWKEFSMSAIKSHFLISRTVSFNPLLIMTWMTKSRKRSAIQNKSD